MREVNIVHAVGISFIFLLCLLSVGTMNQIAAPTVGRRWTEVLTMINAWNLLWIIPLAASVGAVILAIVVAGVDVEEDE